MPTPRPQRSSRAARRVPIILEEPYRTRAAPPGSARYWSWLFAAPEARGPLLGMYALMAEWRALQDPAIDGTAAQLKLAWWRDEVRRLAAGSPLHPIGRHLLALPGGARPEWLHLEASLDATAAQVAGVPLARTEELKVHAGALYGMPLRLAAQMSARVEVPDRTASSDTAWAALTALAAAQYLTQTVADRCRDAHAGRVCFPVEELLAAGIDNDDLAAPQPSPRLQAYLNDVRGRCAAYFSTALASLGDDARRGLRHVAVLATLGNNHLREHRDPTRSDFRLRDLYNAWNAARAAAA